MRKPTFKHIEYEIYIYHDTVKEIKRLQKDIIYANTSDDENVGGGRASTTPGRPTERIATRLATNKVLQNLESIAYAIETVYNESNNEYKRLIRLKYWTKPQTKTWDGIAEELNVSKRQAMRWRDEIVYKIGEKLGWR
ncbi:MAG: transcriptional regulator [Weizmannia coagulans]|jgi:RinA family phage transcriptional activator|nr:transcriptional regulator [Heyndrickxia coagulans]